MDRPHILRLLRIALTALSLTACVLVASLWIRSVYRVDLFYNLSVTTDAYVWSCNGKAFINIAEVKGLSPTDSAVNNMIHKSRIAFMEKQLKTVRELGVCPVPRTNNFGFRWWDWNTFVVPYWFPFAATASIAASPWIGLRFSLRTLPIATTLAAVLLGAIVYAVR